MHQVAMDKAGSNQPPVLAAQGVWTKVSACTNQVRAVEPHDGAATGNHPYEHGDIDGGQNSGGGIVAHAACAHSTASAARGHTGTTVAKYRRNTFLVDLEF